MTTSDYIGPEQHMWSQQKVTGPVWVKFRNLTETDCYVDVTKILIIREWSGHSRIVMQGDVPCDLYETTDEIMKRLKEVNRELTL